MTVILHTSESFESGLIIMSRLAFKFRLFLAFCIGWAQHNGPKNMMIIQDYRSFIIVFILFLKLFLLCYDTITSCMVVDTPLRAAASMLLPADLLNYSSEGGGVAV